MGRMLSRSFRYLIIFVLVIVASWFVQNWLYEEEIISINGKVASVIDGDSFRVGKEEFRIYGIDAPEYRQTCKDEKGADWPCGKAARSGLDRILREEDHDCAVHARDQFGRVVVKCTSSIGQDLSALLVASGLAASGAHFDEVIYADDERQAQKTRRGIWRGEFVRPDIWREQNPRKNTGN